MIASRLCRFLCGNSPAFRRARYCFGGYAAEAKPLTFSKAKTESRRLSAREAAQPQNRLQRNQKHRAYAKSNCGNPSYADNPVHMKTPLTRRGFLKTSTLAAGAGLTLSKALKTVI